VGYLDANQEKQLNTDRSEADFSDKPWQPEWINIKMPPVANSKSSFETLTDAEASQAVAKWF
jgi:hypothetical protein